MLYERTFLEETKQICLTHSPCGEKLLFQFGQVFLQHVKLPVGLPALSCLLFGRLSRLALRPATFGPRVLLHVIAQQQQPSCQVYRYEHKLFTVYHCDLHMFPLYETTKK